jgi:hypothetical protein
MAEDVVVPIETVAVPVPIHRYRVLFSDGAVVDFLAGRDDSNLREHMRITHWGAKGPDSVKAKDGVTRAIVGVTDLGEELVYTPDATAPPA